MTLLYMSQLLRRVPPVHETVYAHHVTMAFNPEPEVLEQIPADKRDALLGVLRSDPRPSYQHDPERLYGLSFGGVEVKFKVDGDVLTVVSTGKLKKNKKE